MRYDNIEDRKEIYNMLSNYLDEQKIKEFLQWCCSKANTHNILRPGKRSTYDPREVYWQIMSLIYMHNLNADLVVQELERRAKLK